jgi:hypothetical protein
MRSDRGVLIRRATLFLNSGRVEQVLYPSERPHRCAEQMVSWLKATGAGDG